jgi:hypothetical protein
MSGSDLQLFATFAKCSRSSDERLIANCGLIVRRGMNDTTDLDIV